VEYSLPNDHFISLYVDPERRAACRRGVGARQSALLHECVGCKTPFCVLWNTKLVNGTVLEVLTSTSGRRANLSHKVEWKLPAWLSVKTIKLRSVQPGEAPSGLFKTHQDSASDPAPEPRAAVEDDDVARQTESATYSQSDLVASNGDVTHAVGDGSIVVHDVVWKTKKVLEDIGGPVPHRTWSVLSVTGDTVAENCDDISRLPRSAYDYFMAMFPHDQLARMLLLTSKVLEENKKLPTTAGEVLKVIGILTLGTKFEFGKRHELWSTVGRNRLLDGANFRAKPGMYRNRFEDLWSCITFGEQSHQDGESSVQKR
jgi:Transposase IS4